VSAEDVVQIQVTAFGDQPNIDIAKERSEAIRIVNVADAIRGALAQAVRKPVTRQVQAEDAFGMNPLEGGHDVAAALVDEFECFGAGAKGTDDHAFIRTMHAEERKRIVFFPADETFDATLERDHRDGAGSALGAAS
jgi:hypothetical protein